MSLLRKPLVVLLLGIFAGAAAGLYPIWKSGAKLVESIVVARAIAEKEKKAQGWDFWTIEIDNLASELKDEKARLRQVAEQLDLRAARLDSEQQELDGLRKEIERMRTEISEKVIEINNDESKNLRTLAQTYGNLSPTAAVAIIRELDDKTAVKILSLMKPEVVSPIFEEMSRSNSNDGPMARRAALIFEQMRLLKSKKSG